MKFRHNKIKREHSIIQGALDWLEDLSKNREVIDIIPGVIDVTNSKERGVFYQYETPTGSKIMLKSGGSIQEAFVVTKKPEGVRDWVTKIMNELELMKSALDDVKIVSKSVPVNKTKTTGINKQVRTVTPLTKRDDLLAGIREEYQLVEINQGLRDSLVDSLASMADLDNPKLEDALDPEIRQELEKYSEKKEK